MEKVGFNDLSNSLTLNLKSNLVPLLTLPLFLILILIFLFTVFSYYWMTENEMNMHSIINYKFVISDELVCNPFLRKSEYMNSLMYLKSQLYAFFTKYLDRCGEPPYSHFVPLQNAWCKSPSPNYTKFNSLTTRFTDPQMSYECQWWHYCHGQHKNKITTTKAALPSALCQQCSHWKVSNALIFQRSQTCPHGLSVQLSVPREAQRTISCSYDCSVNLTP